MDTQLLRVGEAARVLNVSRWTVYRWVDEGKLTATKIGKQSLRVIGNSVDKLITENRTHH
ncbi:MAG: helix-turn-helix domain-containing protein [Nitrospira sp. CG24C]|jgi:excisionase family DNA binding protein|nr:helix-turn-helix domain-containing protein [Nitrospira sp.]THJ12428.1 MAG: helix-turn-helix domain-containing protein [Nitrospira sp. CG24C]TKB52568.1 MAG: helix-turn-helix domain-containing protein [Nitrospira sp.]